MNIKQIARRKSVMLAAGALVLAAAGSAMLGGGAEEKAETEVKARTVTLIDLADIGSRAGGVIEASGSVRAAQEADLVAETSGVVRTVHVRIGDTVGRGQALITLSNADAAAQVAQARAGLQAALSAANSSDVGLENAEVALRDAVQSVARTIDDVRGTKIAPLFEDPAELRGFGTEWSVGNTTYRIEARVNPSGLSAAADEAVEAMDELKEEVATGGDIERKVETAERALEATRDLLDAIAVEINRYSSESSSDQSVYDRFQGDISAARSAITGSISSLSGARQAFRATESRDSAPAIAQARAAVQAAEAQLAKTVVRAPFAGRVLSVEPEPGEFIGMGAPAVSLLSTAGKEAVVYLNADGAAAVERGARVTIDGEYEGTVSRKAPGIDPQTGKIEVVVSVPDSAPIAIGEFVTVEVAANRQATGGARIPLKAVRMSSEGAMVFTVEDGVAVARPVEIGALSGEYVTVLSGLDGLESIVSNVRGITPGQKVTVADN